MAKTFSMGNTIESRPKKTRQGKGKHSKYSATSRNSKIVKDTKDKENKYVLFDCESTLL